MNLLHLDHVTRTYGALTAVDNLTLTVDTGDRVAIVGPNGAGKSTLAGLIDGTIHPTAGRILLDGRDITRQPIHRRAAAGIARVYQHPQLFDRHTILGNVLLALRRQMCVGGRILPLRPAHDRLLGAWALDILATVGLAGAHRSRAGELSHGQRRQLDIAVALAMRPRLLLLDEPTAGLAGPDTERIIDVLQQLRGDITIVIIDHDPQVVAAIATTVVRLDNGAIVAEPAVAR